MKALLSEALLARCVWSTHQSTGTQRKGSGETQLVKRAGIGYLYDGINECVEVKLALSDSRRLTVFPSVIDGSLPVISQSLPPHPDFSSSACDYAVLLNTRRISV